MSLIPLGFMLLPITLLWRVSLLTWRRGMTAVALITAIRIHSRRISARRLRVRSVAFLHLPLCSSALLTKELFYPETGVGRRSERKALSPNSRQMVQIQMFFLVKGIYR